MKCLLVADLHYALKQYDWLMHAATGFDVVIIAGDHLDLSSHVPRPAQIVVVLKYLQRLRALTTLVTCSGNHDLDAHTAEGEKSARWFADIRNMGIPADGDSQMIDGTLFTICPWWDGPVTRAAVSAQLALDAAKEKKGGVYHAPADSPTSWDGKRSYGDKGIDAVDRRVPPRSGLQRPCSLRACAAGRLRPDRVDVASAVNADATRLQRATEGLDLVERKAISKYNHAPRLSECELGLAECNRKGRVLVVDQTRGDSSIAYGLASSDTFGEMLCAAKVENPSAEILIKLHPEVVSGLKQGHFAGLTDSRLKLIDHDVNPWSLIEIVDKVYVVTSQLGFEAVMARKHVACFGAPFYAGWGLTDDRQPIARRRVRPTLEQLFTAVYFDYSRYVSPDTKREFSFEDAVEWIAHERREFWAARS